MNDLRTLRATLTPDEPSQDVVDRSRHRLQNRMLSGPKPRKRVGLLTVGAGLTAAAIAAAVVVVASPGAPGPQGVVPAVTAGNVLLAAATAAERAPAGSGAYWYVKVTVASLPTHSQDVYEYWTSADGRTLWFRGAKSGGRVEQLTLARTGFSLGVVTVTLDQLQGLPTDPAALRAWLVTAVEKSGTRTSAGPPTASDRELFVLQTLISLVSTTPAPPQIRAAAFRAIAAYPGVRELGAVPGGQGLMLPEGVRLVVDPATGRVNKTSMYMSVDGGAHYTDDPDGAAISADWTDVLPE
ncbi:CU044_5270 family protein [Amycolatopsis sp. lyj-112]|uniref:CU044_5270 family protein n=1 Tax=Amycolatopsis sp. lyj-112 TaxID=2789288 RepID=UPI00397ABF17